MSTRRKLTEIEKQECAALKAMWNKRKAERRQKGIKFTQELAAEKLGFESQGAISHYLNAKIPLNTDVILKFAKFLQCTPTDIRASLKDFIERPDRQSAINKVTKEKITLNSDPSNFIAGYNHELQEINASYSVNKVPLISWVSAGFWCEAIDVFSPGHAEEWLPCPVKCSQYTYALRVSGDSMTSMIPGAKSYPDGCIIYVDPEIEVVNGKRVIAKLIDKNEVTFKTYKEDAGKKWLMPLNPQYENILIDENVIICGVVIAKYEIE